MTRAATDAAIGPCLPSEFADMLERAAAKLRAKCRGGTAEELAALMARFEAELAIELERCGAARAASAASHRHDLEQQKR